MNNVNLGSRHKQERGEDLVGKLPYEIERNTVKVSVPQQIVQIVRQQLKHQAQMIPESKVLDQPH